MDEELLARLTSVYRDLHRHPELSSQEHRTAGVVTAWLRDLGLEVLEGIGGTGVVGILRNGPGPTVALRADMDALPVAGETGLPYASTVDGVMHACGHDVHVTCLLGAATTLDAVRSGPAFAATDSLKVTLHGTGGHGSRPESTVDPVVMAAATVLRLQTLVAREVAATDTAVLTVGALNAGTKANIIPDRAELLLNVRSYDESVRSHLLDAIGRVVRAESDASAAPRPPDVEHLQSAPAVVNDADAALRASAALEGVVGAGRVVDPGPVTGSEDVGVLATAAGAPLVFWLLGGADPAAFAGASTPEQLMRAMAAGRATG